MKLTKSGQSNFSEQPPRRRICTSWIVPLLLLWMLPAGLGFMSAGRVSAQVFTTLYSFTDYSYGGYPSSGLILSGNTLYGSAGDGSDVGVTVFAVNTDGTGFTNIYSWGYGGFPSDLDYGLSGLILSGNTLYGTASQISWGGVLLVWVDLPALARCSPPTAMARVLRTLGVFMQIQAALGHPVIQAD